MHQWTDLEYDELAKKQKKSAELFPPIVSSERSGCMETQSNRREPSGDLCAQCSGVVEVDTLGVFAPPIDETSCE